MRRRLQRILEIGVLILATGCFGGAGLAADLPQARPFPTPHPPDAVIMTRELEQRWEKQLNVALVRATPVVNWALFGLVVAF